MKTPHFRFIEPLDVLFLRGNKLFGAPGTFGESLVPPWPSVAAGAFRSRMLVDDGVDLTAFARGEVDHPTLGTPRRPGAFALVVFHLARRFTDGRVEAMFAPPADLVVSENEKGESVVVRALIPTPLPGGEGLGCSALLPLLPVLAKSGRGKPAGGYWLTQAGWKKYLTGETPQAEDLVETSALWALDERIGVGLDAATRRAADGRLFSVQAVAMAKRGHAMQNGFDVGFLAAVTGAEPPGSGTLRLGGDGRAAAIRIADDAAVPESDYEAIAEARRCRLVLTTPGIFTSPPPRREEPEVRESGGWLPTGATRTADGAYRFDLHGVSGRLVCAAVPRAEVVSGWDLAAGQPKPALRAVPTGSVYWLEDLGATPDALRKLAECGLWGEPCEDTRRRAEGFNRITLAAYRVR